MEKTKPGVYFGVIGAMVMWAMTFVWFKIVNEVYPPFTIVFLRLLISTLVMLGIAAFTKVLQKLKRRDVLFFLLLALVYPTIYFIGEGIGLTMIESSLAAVIVSTIPLFVPIGAYFWLHEKVTRLNIIGILVSFSGVVIVILNPDFSINADPTGILLMLLAVFSAVGYTLMVKKLTKRYNAYSITTYQNIFGTLMFFPIFLVFEGGDFAGIQHTAKAMLNLGYLAIFGSSLAFILFNYSIKTIGATRTEAFSNLIPVMTAIFAWFMLGEELGVKKILGISVVLAGLFISQMKSRKNTHKHLIAPRVSRVPIRNLPASGGWLKNKFQFFAFLYLNSTHVQVHRIHIVYSAPFYGPYGSGTIGRKFYLCISEPHPLGKGGLPGRKGGEHSRR